MCIINQRRAFLYYKVSPFLVVYTFFTALLIIKGSGMFLPFKAMGKQRVDRNRFTGAVFTPDKTRQFEGVVAIYGRLYAVKANLQIKDIGPKGVSFDTVYYLPMPKAWSKKKKQEALLGNIRPCVKPDNDNVEKILFDALNTILYKDDAYIVENSTKKFYAFEPSIEVIVKYL